MVSSGFPTVLGVCTGTHDSAAALISEGRLIGLVEEERFNGEKHTHAYPHQAITWLLKEAGLTRRDIAAVAYNFNPAAYRRAVWTSLGYLASVSSWRRFLPRARSFRTVQRRAAGRVANLARNLPQATVVGVEHHRAHGMYAFAASGFDEAAVLIVDSLGETTTTSIAHAHTTSTASLEYRPLRRISDPASLGYAYGAITEHLGWRRGDEEGTVMALGALGDPARFRRVLAQAIPLTDDGFALDPRYFPLRVISSRYPRVSSRFIEAACPPRAAHEPLEQVHSDLAAALQERIEQAMVHLARLAKRLSGASRLCVGGGVAMNCLAIGRIVEQAGFDEISVPPAPGDSGTAAGAALATHLDTAGTGVDQVAQRCYLGPSYDGHTLPNQPRPGLSARRVAHPARHLARELSNGRIVGLCRGRLESGPRALGNRSILASPLQAEVVERLNQTVKFREPFRPFAPVVLADKAADYFTLGQPVPFMSIASGVTELARRTIPAVIHANGTARIQTLTPEQNPFLAEVLAAFADLTGVPVMINTSLNIKGKPICATPEDALDCLAASGLDALLINDWWVAK